MKGQLTGPDTGQTPEELSATDTVIVNGDVTLTTTTTEGEDRRAEDVLKTPVPTPQLIHIVIDLIYVSVTRTHTMLHTLTGLGFHDAS